MTATQHAESNTDDGGITPEQFEAGARAFLDAGAERRPEETFVWGQGSENVSLFPERTPEQQATDLAASRDWAQRVFDAGFGWITGPVAYGGRGLSDDFQRIWNRVATDYQTPSLSIYGIGLGMVAPTILAHATDEVKEAYLRKMWRGDIVACQLFSEPSSGSPRCRHAPSVTATSGSSTARRCGRRVPRCRTSGRSSAAPTPTSPSTAG
jgi:alkylation response protein AidB-like acyl-CoA dehydrogenase